MAIELAKAYVQVLPSADGIKGNLENVMNGEADKAGKSAGGKLASGIGSALAGGAAVIGAGVSAAAAGVSALSKSALSAYADYEQLTGGVETLFGDSADVILKYADEAYRTAGISANKYMETVTSFSASLLQSLDGDTAQAAEYAQTAITDMSDNANKMGSSMESIQNAYQGFAKQNFTMLDNLKLGYGGTKTEMQRLLEDATELTGVEYDIESYKDIVSAIHAIQTEMKISGISAEEAAEAIANGTMTEEEAFNALGTTAKEAATTISGSIGSTKAAWTNFLTSMNDSPEKVGATTDALVNSVVTAANNIVPKLTAIIPNIINGIGTIIQALMPQIPAIIGTLLPAIISGATALVQQLITVLPQILASLSVVIPDIIQAITTMMPMLIDAALQIIITLGQGIVDAMPKLIEKIPELITKLVDAIVENLPMIIETGIQILLYLVIGIVQAIPELILAIPKIITAIVDGIKSGIAKIKEVGPDLVAGLWQGIKDSWSKLVDGVKDLGSNLISGIKGIFGIHSPSTEFASIGEMCDAGLAEGLGGMKDTIADTKGMLADEMNDNFGMKTSLDVRSTLSTIGNVTPARSEGADMGSKVAAAVYDALSNLALNASISGTPDMKKFFSQMRVEAKLYKNRTGQEAFV